MSAWASLSLSADNCALLICLLTLLCCLPWSGLSVHSTERNTVQASQTAQSCSTFIWRGFSSGVHRTWVWRWYRWALQPSTAALISSVQETRGKNSVPLCIPAQCPSMRGLQFIYERTAQRISTPCQFMWHLLGRYTIFNHLCKFGVVWHAMWCKYRRPCDQENWGKLLLTFKGEPAAGRLGLLWYWNCFMTDKFLLLWNLALLLQTLFLSWH